VPLRLAKPFAGKRQTGMHFPALEGDEAVIAFLNGNPNTPYIAGFHHHSDAVDLVTSQDRWMSRNVIRTQSGNKLRMEDWEGQEHVKLSTPHSGKSQLTLGHIVDGAKKQRGEGFELRTSARGAIRTGRGLLLSTHDRPNAQGMQGDMQEGEAQLNAARDQFAALAQRAIAAEVKAADVEAINQVLQDEIKDLRRAMMMLAANGSAVMTSPNTIWHSAGENLTFTAGKDADVAAMGSVHVAAAQQISLFAPHGIQHVSDQGPVTLQAQNAAMVLQALKDLNLVSADGSLNLMAKQQVRISAGGSTIVIDGVGIQCITPGDIVEKCSSWKKAGPASEDISSELRNSLPGLSLRLNPGASPAAMTTLPRGMPYTLLADGMPIEQGVIDDTGPMPVDHKPGTKAYHLELANGVTYHLPVGEQFRGDAANGELANRGFHYHEAPASGEDRAVHRKTYTTLLDPQGEGRS
jgi:type VI secretion system secreted protein VgrG